MEDRSRSPSRRTSRVEQVVGRWLRRSRDLGSRSHSQSRDRAAAEGKAADSCSSAQKDFPFRFSVQIQKDPTLRSHGLTVSAQSPIVVQEVTPGGPADGRLVPGDQLVKINNVSVDDLSPEQAAEVIRECQDTLTMTVLRIMQGPKSSFITPEKRAKLRSNPVKVHFAEEVEVNGHSQGNSLLFLPNVLKVYLENGQTKAFKFDPSTTVKDIVLTLKEKLSLSRIEHFSLVLEQQHHSSKLLLLHDEERVQQVVQKKEVQAYRCLFRVCFMPKDLRTLQLDDATAFEYLYLQGVNDVLLERYAVEMRCNTALRLAALNIQERLVSCGLSPKANLKTVTKTWGIENFVSSTLLRNMREKDLKKAISHHMKKSQPQHDPKQKVLSVDQARLNYLQELSELKCFGGKTFSATLMLQDRESTVTLLVGARFGVSQVVNKKLSIMTTLTEFTSITRVELLPESDKVSLVKIYLQDIKPITLLLEAAAAKDMSCLIAGYCRVFVDPKLNVFSGIDDKKHRVSAEEGYVSRCASDSDSSDLDMEPLLSLTSNSEKSSPRVSEGRKRKNRDGMRKREQRESKKLKEQSCPNAETENPQTNDAAGLSPRIHIQITDEETGQKAGHKSRGGAGEDEQPSEASDSCQSDSRVLTSPSSDSLDALEEDDLISCSSSSVHQSPHPQAHICVHSPYQLHLHSDSHVQPHLLAPPPAHSHPLIHLTVVSCGGEGVGGCQRRYGDGADPQLAKDAFSSQSPEGQRSALSSVNSSMCFAELSRLADLLPSPPEASEEDDAEEVELEKGNQQKELDVALGKSEEGDGKIASSSSTASQKDFVFNFDQSDARCYYNLCSNITPDSAQGLPRPQHLNLREVWKDEAEGLEPIPILHPPPGFGDSSSDEEFYDARDRFTSPEDPAVGGAPRAASVSLVEADDDTGAVVAKEQHGNGEGGRENVPLRKRSKKRRSYMETNYTTRVTYPDPDPESKPNQASSSLLSNLLSKTSKAQPLSSDPELSGQSQIISPTVASLTYSEGEPAELELKPLPSKLSSHIPGALSSAEQDRDTSSPSRTRKQEMEMEPDALEFKSVTDLIRVVSPTITVVRCRVDPDGKESADRRGDGKEEGEEQEIFEEKKEATDLAGPLMGHLLFPDIIKEEDKAEENIKDEISSSLRPLISAESVQETEVLPKNGLLGNHLVPAQTVDFVDDLSLPLTLPPPPPTSPLLPQAPAVTTAETEEGGSKSMETSTRSAEESPDVIAATSSLSNNSTSLTCDLKSSTEDGNVRVEEFIVTAADEVTESSNSDNVFEDDDDDNSYSLIFGTDGKTDDMILTSQFCHDKDKDVQPSTNRKVQTKSNSVSLDPSLSMKRVSAKKPTSLPIDPGASLKNMFTSQNVVSNTRADKTKSDSTLLSAKDNLLSSSLMVRREASAVSDLSPTHFLFQICSPTIMGRLSAYSLRGKIQNLPLYLSRSQESLNRSAGDSTAKNPLKDTDKENPNITAQNTDTQDVAQVFEFETSAVAESADSDDSDTTLTGLELEGGASLEMAESFPPRSEAKEEGSLLPVQTEPKHHHGSLSSDSPGPVTEPPLSMSTLFQRDSSPFNTDTPGPVKCAPEMSIKVDSLQEDVPGVMASSQAPIVVTAQNLNGPRPTLQTRTSKDRPLMGLCSPSEQVSDPSVLPSPGCRVFNICKDLTQTEASSDLASFAPPKPEASCGSVLLSGCESVVDSLQVPLDACGCQTVYADCFGSGDSFDDELTVYEFSCRSQSGSVDQASTASLNLIVPPPAPTFTSPPQLSRSGLCSPSSSELSPLLSPQFDAADSSCMQKDTIAQLGRQRYPGPPAGFQFLRADVNKLLSILESCGTDRAVTGLGGCHQRDTCPAHFIENKRALQLEARQLMSGCQRVAGLGQSPEEMLQSLADSFQTLVELAAVCLWFSGCDRCEQRNAEAVAGLADVARSFRDLCLAAERASSKRSCQDLSTKLLAKQCTALTASVFCLTQLFRTLTAL